MDLVVGVEEKPLPKDKAAAKKKAQEFYDALVKAKKDLTGRDLIRKKSSLSQLYRCTGAVGKSEVKVAMADGTKSVFKINK